jgi:hypothetical protein
LKGVNADRYSLKPADFREFRQRLNAGRVRFPCPETDLGKLAERDPRSYAPFPVARLLLQLLTVRQIGQKVEKPMNGTDDLFRSMVLADTIAEEYRELLVARLDDRGLPLTRGVGVVGQMAHGLGGRGHPGPSRTGAMASGSRASRLSSRWPW